MKRGRKGKMNTMVWYILMIKAEVYSSLLISIWMKTRLWNSWGKILVKVLRSLRSSSSFKTNRCLNIMLLLNLVLKKRSIIRKCMKKSSFGMTKGLSYGHRHIHTRNWSFRHREHLRSWLAILIGLSEISMTCSAMLINWTPTMENLLLKWVRRSKRQDNRNCINWDNFQRLVNNSWKKAYSLNCTPIRRSRKWGQFSLTTSKKVRFPNNSNEISYQLWTARSSNSRRSTTQKTRKSW